MAKKASNPVDGEHIFPASKLTPLAVQWKQLNATGRHKEAMLVLEEIVIGSTAMFQRLAQFEDFHYTVDLPILVSAAQEKVIKWLAKWQPKKGKLFSWFSKCAKNAFKSELVKVNQYRKRYHVTSEHLEKFYGVEDHEVNKHDLSLEVRKRITDIICRWSDPQIIGALRFSLECIVEDEHDRQAVVRSAAYAYCLSLEFSKYLYEWCTVALRTAFYDKAYIPYTEYELLMAAESFTFLPDLFNIIGIEKGKEVLAIFGGHRIKFPTLQAVALLVEKQKIARDIERSDQDPDAVVEVARKYKRTQRAAEQIFNEMLEIRDPRRYGEYGVFDEDSGQ